MKKYAQRLTSKSLYKVKLKNMREQLWIVARIKRFIYIMQFMVRIRKFQHIVMCMKTVTRSLIRERSRYTKIFCRLHTIISLPACDVGVDTYVENVLKGE